MIKKHLFLAVIMVFAAVSGWAAGGTEVPYGGTIKIGHVAPITGDIPKVGEEGTYSLNMLVEDLNKAGGIKVGQQTYKIKVVTEDNESKAESAVSATTKLITEDQVLAIIGSYASKQAIPTGEVANARKTPNISPWSTNPRTTKDRPWVFRACFIDPYQGKVAATFAKEEFGVKKVAVLYDVASDYPKGLAENFKASAEQEGMVMAAFETFTTKDRDFSSQLTKIIGSGAELLFVPQYYDEVPLIVKQARQLGWNKPILGSDSWSSPELVKLAGKDVIGSFFTSHYAMKGATGVTKQFIDKYNAKYGYIPGDVAALAWDAGNILFQAIKNTGGLTGNVEKDRQAIRDQLAKVKRWEGTTGLMSFTEEGDPIKCVVIVRIDEQGEFSFYKMACPPELK
ncbi:MAG: ABC transporter substrate-binding protein [Spirochaetota bacterium]